MTTYKQIYYILKFFKNKDEDAQDIELTQMEGQKIIMLLTGEKSPQFILIHGSLKATSSIKGVDEDANFSPTPYPKLTTTEMMVNKKFLQFTGQDKKLLN